MIYLLPFSLGCASLSGDAAGGDSLYDEPVEQFLHIGRHAAFESQSVAIYGMNKPQMRRV
jgi:hypothetical protein